MLTLRAASMTLKMTGGSTWQQGGLFSEAMLTQSAQRVGYRIGNDYFKERLLPVR
ncbi:MAG: hypothetical protein JNL75_09420 [Chitinophagales bacterium]|nr:hypothetical protein [Chitinophagales bacterium]